MIPLKPCTTFSLRSRAWHTNSFLETWAPCFEHSGALLDILGLEQPQRNQDEIDIDDDDDEPQEQEKPKPANNQQLGRLELEEKAAPASLYGALLQVRSISSCVCKHLLFAKCFRLVFNLVPVRLMMDPCLFLHLSAALATCFLLVSVCMCLAAWRRTTGSSCSL
jgi:hypothetical protein